MKDSFLLYKSFYGPVSGLSDKQLGRLFRAIFLYQIDGSTQVDADIQMAFAFFKNQMDIDGGKYQKVIERNKRNGSKGGRPSKGESLSRGSENPNNPKNPVGFLKPKKADNENEYNNLSLIDSSSSPSPDARTREEGDNPEETETGGITTCAQEAQSRKSPDVAPEKGCAEKAPPPPFPDGTYEYIPVAAVADYLTGEDGWIESLCMNKHLDRAYVEQKIREYAADLQNSGEVAKDKRDCKRHFNNWLRKSQQYEQDKRIANYEPRTAANRPYGGDMSVDEFDRATCERVARRLATGRAQEVGGNDGSPADPF